MNQLMKVAALVAAVSGTAWYYTKKIRPRNRELAIASFKKACEESKTHEAVKIVSKTAMNTSDFNIGLVLASNKNNVELVKFLLDHRADNLNAGLYAAVKGNGRECTELFLLRGATNVNDCLAIACKSNKIALVQLLVKAGANPNVGLLNSKSLNITNVLMAAKQVPKKLVK